MVRYGNPCTRLDDWTVSLAEKAHGPFEWTWRSYGFFFKLCITVAQYKIFLIYIDKLSNIIWMKIINLSRVGIFFCPKFASKVAPKISQKVARNVSPKYSNRDVSMISPKYLHKAISSKFLTKHPSSVRNSHVVVSLSLYIFGIFCS